MQTWSITDSGSRLYARPWTRLLQETEKAISGTVRLKLYKGNAMLVGRRSPHSLYREDYVTFDEDDVYNQADAEGFIRLFGLPLEGRGTA